MPKRLISVALPTCNGERFVTEQLASMAAQTRLPDEVVVSDDSSSDQTVSLVEDFARHAPFPVRLLVHSIRAGISANYERALGQCSGHFIALSYQDDVWLPDKLQRCEDRLLAKPGVGLVFSDAQVVDSSLRPLPLTIWSTVEFDERRQMKVRAGQGHEVLLERNIVTGATVVFRAEFLNLALPFPLYWVHDAWLALIISIYADLDFIEAPTILYRQHDRNAVGIPFLYELIRAADENAPRGRRFRRPRALINDLQKTKRRQCQELYAHIRRHVEAELAGDAPEWLASPQIHARVARVRGPLLQHLETRATLSPERARRVLPILRELVSLRYARFSRGRILPFGLTAALADVLSHVD